MISQYALRVSWDTLQFIVLRHAGAALRFLYTRQPANCCILHPAGPIHMVETMIKNQQDMGLPSSTCIALEVFEVLQRYGHKQAYFKFVQVF